MIHSATAERVLDAYGGAARWRAATSLELVLSARGLAFRLKWQPPLVRARQLLSVHEPRVRCAGIDRAGDTGILEGQDVCLEAPGGRLIGARRAARSSFGPGRRWLFWDRLDQSYFACDAAWNYFTYLLSTMSPTAASPPRSPTPPPRGPRLRARGAGWRVSLPPTPNEPDRDPGVEAAVVPVVEEDRPGRGEGRVSSRVLRSPIRLQPRKHPIRRTSALK